MVILEGAGGYMLIFIYSIVMILGGLFVFETPLSQERVIFTNGNIYTVYNRPTKPTRFVLPRAMVVTTIANYHWNNAKGARPGTIALRDASGRTFGPWSASGSPGMNGVPNANWTVTANVRLEPGEYTVIDSDIPTWSHNSQSANAGMTTVKGYVAGSPTPPPTPKPTPTPGTGSVSKVTALTENRAKYKVLIWVDGKPPKTPMDVLNYHLEPGWKGSLPVTIPANGQVKFVAGDGRGGPGSMYDNVLTTCVWTGDPKNVKRYPHIIFEPGGTLTCSTGTKP